VGPHRERKFVAFEDPRYGGVAMWALLRLWLRRDRHEFRLAAPMGYPIHFGRRADALSQSGAAGPLAQKLARFLKFRHNSGSDILIGGRNSAPIAPSQRPQRSKPWRTLSIVNRE